MTQFNRPKASLPWTQPIRAMAFDMDGLLVNTEELYTEVGNAILGRLGHEFTRELKRNMMGLPGNKAWSVMIEYARLDDSIEQLAIEAEEIFADLLPKKLAVLPGVFELLKVLDDSGLPRCVATSSSNRFACEVLERVDLIGRIDFIITADDVVNGKPAPDIYLAAAKSMAVPVEMMMVLEDSQHGSQAGVAAGACTVAVPGDHSADHDFAGVHFRATTLLDPGIRQILHSAPALRCGD